MINEYSKFCNLSPEWASPHQFAYTNLIYRDTFFFFLQLNRKTNNNSSLEHKGYHQITRLCFLTASFILLRVTCEFCTTPLVAVDAWLLGHTHSPSHIHLTGANSPNALATSNSSSSLRDHNWGYMIIGSSRNKRFSLYIMLMYL